LLLTQAKFDPEAAHQDHAGTRLEFDPAAVPTLCRDAGRVQSRAGFQIDRDTLVGDRVPVPAPDIRKLIERKREELEQHGVCRMVRQTSGVLGGRPRDGSWF
jgi:hypothetical protein